MKDRKNYEIALFVAGCIIINLVGKLFAEGLSLPLWLDSFGTVMAAYVLGPICGAIVGVSVNIIRGFSEPFQAAYALTGMVIGLATGFLARKKAFESLFGIMTAAFLIAVIASAVSVPLNCIHYSGYIGNVWGDGVIDMFEKFGVIKVFCYISGQFYMEFPDKVLTFAVLFAVVRLYRRRNNKINLGVVSGLLPVLAAVCFAIPLFGMSARAEAPSICESRLQTIYDSENGLPGGTANAIEQTKDGILWIGTYGGLYRYNGSEFEWMNEIDSVKNVNCFYADDEGRLWIGTNDSGLTLLINGAAANVIDRNDGLPSDSVRCITKGSGSSYYVGTTDSIAVVTLSGGLSVTETVDGIKYANSISVNADGLAAAVTDAGQLYLISGSEIVAAYSDSETEFTCCAFGEDGLLYVGTTGDRVEVFGTDGSSLTQTGTISCGIMASYIKSLAPYKEYGIIVCADNGAGCINSSGEFYTINTGKFDNSIEHMIFDYQGNMWFTSSRLGLLKLSKSSFTDVFTEANIEERVVNAVLKYDGNIYFGSDDGLLVLTAETYTTVENELTKTLEGVRVRNIMKDSKENLWISTSGKGVIKYGKDGAITVYDSASGALGSRFRNTLELSDGTIVLAGDSGITFITDGKVSKTIGQADGLSNAKILCLSEISGGGILAGSDGGGIAVIDGGKVARTLTKADGLSSEIILRIVDDGEEGKFIVTGSGLCYMNTRQKLRKLNNFPYYNNYDVIESGDTLFVTGSAGIYAVSRESLLNGESLNTVLLSSKEGLHDSLTANSWNYLDEDNCLYLPTSGGVTRFNINEYNTGTKHYRLRLRAVRADGVLYDAEVGETVTIPAGTEQVELIPEVINYSAEDPYVSVCLEGEDSEPTIMRFSELREISYVNLPAGSYKFKMAVLNNKKQEIVNTTYELNKKNEIYDYKWFGIYIWLIGVLAVAYITWMLFRTQVQRTMDIQKRELEVAKKQVEMGNETIITIARTVDAKDVNTSQHSARVSKYSVMIAKELGLSDEECEGIRKTALLHDIGKIGIPDSILNKPARLTDEEYEIMKSHVVKGAEILKHFSSVDDIVVGALYHHERYDGKGYVNGLKGEAIPLSARIIGMADAFDAMTANRVYRKKLDFDYVIAEIKRCRGTQFDPKIADIMLELIHSGRIRKEDLYGEEDDSTSDSTGGDTSDSTGGSTSDSTDGSADNGGGSDT